MADLSTVNLDIPSEDFTVLVEDWLQYQVTEEEDMRQTSAVIESLVSLGRLDLLEIFVQTVKANYEADSPAPIKPFLNLFSGPSNPIPPKKIFTQTSEGNYGPNKPTLLPNIYPSSPEEEEDIISPLDESPYPYISRLLTCNLSEEAVIALSQVVEIDFFTVVRGLVDEQNDEFLSSALCNLQVLFPTSKDIDMKSIESLLLIALNRQGSTVLSTFLSGLVSETKEEVAEVPGWILKSFPLPSHESLVKALPPIPVPVRWKSVSLKEDIDFACKFASEADKEDEIDIDEFRKDLIEAWRYSLVADREDFITGLLVNDKLIDVEYEKGLFQVLGACLPVPNGNTLAVLSTDVCQTRGGCRSLTCSHHCNWDPITEQHIYSDLTVRLPWFTGRCFSCSKIIQKECYSLRLPMASGGWSKENFCSFDCQRSIKNLSAVQALMITRIETAYYTFGILDRTY